MDYQCSCVRGIFWSKSWPFTVCGLEDDVHISVTIISKKSLNLFMWPLGSSGINEHQDHKYDFHGNFFVNLHLWRIDGDALISGVWTHHKRSRHQFHIICIRIRIAEAKSSVLRHCGQLFSIWRRLCQDRASPRSTKHFQTLASYAYFVNIINYFKTDVLVSWRTCNNYLLEPPTLAWRNRSLMVISMATSLRNFVSGGVMETHSLIDEIRTQYKSRWHQFDMIWYLLSFKAPYFDTMIKCIWRLPRQVRSNKLLLTLVSYCLDFITNFERYILEYWHQLLVTTSNFGCR